MDEFNESLSEENSEESVEFPVQFFGTAPEFVAKHNRCTLCDANLHFTHLTDFARNITQETARCLECSTIKPRLMTHKLH